MWNYPTSMIEHIPWCCIQHGLHGRHPMEFIVYRISDELEISWEGYLYTPPEQSSYGNREVSTFPPIFSKIGEVQPKVDFSEKSIFNNFS